MMKRAARLIIASGFFQLHPSINQLDNIGASQKIINKGSWNLSFHLCDDSAYFEFYHLYDGLYSIYVLIARKENEFLYNYQ